MSNQRKDMNVNEARDFVKSKSQDFIKKLAAGALGYGVSKIPGANEGYKKIKEKIPKGFSASYDPSSGKFSAGFKIKF
jgi:glutathione synthase/RimK-type ligase-like ATP-grasp enzyme